MQLDMKLDENGNYLPVLYFDEFWQMKDQLIQINSTVHQLNLTMTYNIISMWKWQFKSQMEQSLNMQDSLSGVEGEGETFKVCPRSSRFLFLFLFLFAHALV
jgi:hypothetical protein